MIFETQPFSHQLEGFERFKDERFFAMFWDMGTGKSKVTIDIAAHKFLTKQCDRMLVVAPNYVHAQWINEQFPLHCPVPYNGFVWRTKSTEAYMNDLFRFLEATSDSSKLHCLAVHLEAFQYDKIEPVLRRFMSGHSTFVTVDEASRIKNPDAKSVKRLSSIVRRHETHRSVLTGTPMAKSPVDVWSLYDFLTPGYIGCTYTAFKHRHAIMTKRRVELKAKNKTVYVDAVIDERLFTFVKRDIRKIKEQQNFAPLRYEQHEELARKSHLNEGDVKLIEESPVFVRFKNVEQLRIQVSPITSSVLKKDCLDLPEKQYQEVILELPKEYKKILRDMQKYAVAVYGEKELTIQHKAALQIRALQVSGGFFAHLRDSYTGNDVNKYDTVAISGPNPKLDYILNDLEELGDQQFLVFAVFTDEIELLSRKLGEAVSIGVLSGATPHSERHDIVERFKAGELQGVVANPEVAGYGLNFQNASVQYWYSRNYRTEARLQAEDRSHRIGIAKSPVYKDLLYDTKFEKQVLASNKEGKHMNDYFKSATVADLFSI